MSYYELYVLSDNKILCDKLYKLVNEQSYKELYELFAHLRHWSFDDYVFDYLPYHSYHKFMYQMSKKDQNIIIRKMYEKIKERQKFSFKNTKKEIKNGLNNLELLRYIQTRNPEICIYLIKKNINLNTIDIFGNTALKYCMNYKQKIVKYLIKKGAYLNVMNNYGFTALSSTYYKHLHRILINHGASLFLSCKRFTLNTNDMLQTLI